jgi:hypothetical protein
MAEAQAAYDRMMSGDARFRMVLTMDRYVICELDRAVPPPVQEAMAARATTVRRVPASHSPFFSRPDDVATSRGGAGRPQRSVAA